jgi:hypothetical protein
MKRIIELTTVSSLLILIFLIYSNEVDDLDLWWELKSGQIIYETRSIPSQDDFSYTAVIPDKISEIGRKGIDTSETSSEKLNRYWTSTFIKRKWLSQLILYIAYLLGGFKGLGLMKSAVFAVAYLVLYLTMLRRGAGYVSSLLVLCLIAFIGIDFNYTRSQMFSYTLFPCLLYVLYDFKSEGKYIYALPVIMAFWANMHGGFVLGAVIITAFTLAECTKYVLRRVVGISAISSLNMVRLKILLVFSILSILISLASPGGYSTYFFPLMLSKSTFVNVEEYLSPQLYEYHAYWFMLALVWSSVFFLFIRKKLDLTETFLILIVTILSIKGIKFIIFFALGASVFLAFSLTCAASWLKCRKPVKWLFNAPVLSTINLKTAATLFLTAILLLTLIKTGVYNGTLKFYVREHRYPSGAVDFISKNKPPGRIFNLFNWGGYIIWFLYPDYRVFIYGRALNETAYSQYNQIIKASKGNEAGIPLWKRLLNAHDVNIIMTSAVSSSGVIIPLVDALNYDEDWALIYADGKSMIFIRNTKDNTKTLHRYRISKETILDEIITESEHGIVETPASWPFYETLGFAYLKKSRFRDAHAMFKKYLSINPRNQKVRNIYEMVEKYLQRHEKNIYAPKREESR